MAVLEWDQVGERTYQGGVDRGVLYLNDGRTAPWNGLLGVDDTSDSEVKSSYIDGVKYLNVIVPGDFTGKLKALTYPEEFDSVNGIAEIASGFEIYDQPAKSFGLSYRTRLGNDVEGFDLGYKIHILYNLVAKPDVIAYNTLGDSTVKPVEFAWSLTGTPPKIGKFKPSVHLSINSLDTPPDILALIENVLYGTDVSEPALLTIQEMAEYFGYLGALLIIDHGDGTWSAIDESDAYVTMIDSTRFSISDADAVYLDGNSYQISSTNVNAL